MIFPYVFDSDESRESLLSLQTVFKRSKGPMANLKEDNKFFVPITSHIGIEPRTVRRFFLLFLSQNHEFRAVRAAGELGAVVSRILRFFLAKYETRNKRHELCVSRIFFELSKATKTK